MQEINVSAAVKAAKQIHEAINALTAKKADLTEKIMILTDRNQVLWRMPLRRSDAKDLILKHIDKMAGEFIHAGEWVGSFKNFAFPKGMRPKTFGVVDLTPSSFAASDQPINLQDHDLMLSSMLRSDHLLGIESTKNFYSGTANLAALARKFHAT